MKKENSLKMLEAATRSDILYFFGQGNLIIISKSQEILKSGVCGNHELELELYFYLNTVNLSDIIIVIKLQSTLVYVNII